MEYYNVIKFSTLEIVDRDLLFRALWINLPGLIGLLTICSLCGMVVFAEFFQCNPLKKAFEKDQLLPLYVMEKMNYPGFPGFFTACIFSGALSTISSGLNSLAAVFLQDLLLNYHFKDLPDKKAALASKLLSLLFGAVMILLTFVASKLGGILEAALAIFGVIGGPILGLFILGIFYPWANYKGAYFALTVGLCMSLWLGIGAQVYKPPKLGIIPPPMTTDACPMNFTEPVTNEIQDSPLISFYQISYMWYSLFAVMVTTISGLIFSLLTGSNDLTKIDETLFNPLVVKLMKLELRNKGVTKNISQKGDKLSYPNVGFCHDDDTLGSDLARPIEITML